MKLSAAVIAMLLAVSTAWAQESKPEGSPGAPPTPTTPAHDPSAPADSPLVAAAKRAKGGKIKAGTVITNANMKQIKGAGGSLNFALPSSTPTPEYQPEDDAIPGAGRTKEDWQKLMAGARAAVTSAEESIAALQSKEARLAGDFYAWDDPAYRDGVIKPAWDQARADLEAAKQSLISAKQRLADLEEEARKSGALPGWLR